MKKCPSCNKRKGMSQYDVRKAKSGKKYAKSYCKDCCKYKKKSRTRDIKKQAVEYLGGKCNECGFVGCPAVYDFHHIDPKLKEFSIGSKRAEALDSIKDELDKCVLLCANCHRTLHYNISEG